ncbi:hypothetical protein ACKLNR_000375 [Fusarium oxysporum f. sp. zingiberi]
MSYYQLRSSQLHGDTVQHHLYASSSFQPLVFLLQARNSINTTFIKPAGRVWPPIGLFPGGGPIPRAIIVTSSSTQR